MIVKNMVSKRYHPRIVVTNQEAPQPYQALLVAVQNTFLESKGWTHHRQRCASGHSSLSKSPKSSSKQRETETGCDEDQEVDDVDFQGGDDEEDVQNRARDQEESCVSKCQSTAR
jgi:hypothetical protein